MFPEGTRRTGPTIEPEHMRDGVAYVASRGQVPIVPVGIGGSERAMPSGAKYIRPSKMVIVVGEPIDARPLKESGRVSRSAIRTLTEDLRLSLQSLFDDAQARAGVPGRNLIEWRRSPGSQHTSSPRWDALREAAIEAEFETGRREDTVAGGQGLHPRPPGPDDRRLAAAGRRGLHARAARSGLAGHRRRPGHPGQGRGLGRPGPRAGAQAPARRTTTAACLDHRHGRVGAFAVVAVAASVWWYLIR